MFRAGGRAEQRRRPGDRPDPLFHDLVKELMRPPVHEFSPETRARLLGDDGERFHSHPEQSELAPLVYRRVQTHGADLPPSVRERWHDWSRLTLEDNSLLLGKLEEISSRFAGHRIPVMVFKGPVLAHLTAGLLIRPFHDLDLLVHRHNMEEAELILRSLGYTEIHGAVRREYHHVFAQRGARGVAVVELHFDLGDREMAIAPDVAGVWRRSGLVDLTRCAVRAPGITDHLLLTIMQLPHHAWRLRLLIDVGLMISRWPAYIDWDDLAGRARAWRMWALTASTLSALDSMFGVAVPDAVLRAARPENYARRTQWRLVTETVAARLAGDTDARVCRLARLLLLDRVQDVVPALARQVVSTHDPRMPGQPLARTAWRIAEGARSVPALARVLVRGMNRASRSIHGGQR